MSIKRQAKVLQIKTGVEVQEGFTRDRKRDVVSFYTNEDRVRQIGNKFFEQELN